MVTLSEILAAHEAHTRTMTVHAPEPLPGLAEHFGAPGVEVVHEQTPASEGPGHVVVSAANEELGRVGLEAVKQLVSPEQPPAPGEEPVADRPFRELLELVREATFSSFDRRQLLATAREVEDRAVRVDDGALHSGFQDADALAAQADLYARLAAETGLDVHVYLDGDWPTPDLDQATVHADQGSELGEYWFVLFDGGPETGSACGLLAEGREAGYYGFWTYDPTTVNRVLTHLQDTY